jgi:hypothetical protein
MCIQPGPPCEEYWKASAVFVGTVQSISKVPPMSGPLKLLRVRLTVDEPFKGVKGTSVELFTTAGEGGPAFRVGEQYFVYAFRDEKTERLNVVQCGLTKLVEEADEDLDYARRAAVGATSGEIFGRLWHWIPETPTEPPLNRPLVGLRVSLRASDGTVTSTSTDDRGQFAFTGLSAGRYSVEAPTLPGTYRATLGHGMPMDLTTSHACLQTNFHYEWDGHVRGRVVTADGQPVSGLGLSLLLADKNDPRADSDVRTGSDGEFEFAHLQPDRYRLGFDVSDSQSEQSFRKDSPTVDVSVGEGEDVRVADFVLPADVIPANLEGTVIDVHGTPVGEAGVFVRLDDDSPPGHPISTSAAGTFTVTVIRGRRYHLIVERVAPTYLHGDAEVIVSDDPFSLVITLSPRHESSR